MDESALGLSFPHLRTQINFRDREDEEERQALVIEKNEGSWKLLEKLGFERWGYLPHVLDFDGEEVGEYYYGKRISNWINIT